MANINDVIDMITHESLLHLHQKLHLIPNIVTDYDDRFAQSGFKIGDSLRVRLPMKYVTRTGKTMATGTGADSIAASTTLNVASQIGVDMRFDSSELALDIDDITQRHIIPAMDSLASKIESNVFGLTNSVANVVEAGTKVVYDDILESDKQLADFLAPMYDQSAILDTRAYADILNDNKALFNEQAAISKQYSEAYIGRQSGKDFFRTTLLGNHTTGAEGGGSAYQTNAVTAQEKTLSASDNDVTTGSLIVDTGTKTIKAGDTFTIGAPIYDVHPETKVSTGELKKFVVTADATGAGTLTISPAIIASGPQQNCSAAAANNQTLTFDGAASTTYKQSLLFQKGFACFATADLPIPGGVHAASRKVHDNISLRAISFYEGKEDEFYTRLDVLYGYKILRPELASKIWHT